MALPMSALMRPYRLATLSCFAAALSLCHCGPAGAPANPPASAGPGDTPSTAPGVRVTRDHYGVPHIVANDLRALFTAYGRIVAQDRLWQLEMNRRAARGRLSEVLGEATLEADRYVRITGYTDAELTQQYAGLSDAVRAALTAYTDGINAYVTEVLQRNPSLWPYEFQALHVTFEPWRVEDSMAFTAFMLRRFGEIGGQESKNAELLHSLQSTLAAHDATAVFDDVLWRNDPEAPVTIAPPRGHALPSKPKAALPAPAKSPALTASALAAAALAPVPQAPSDVWRALGVPSRLGSYAWVVSPHKSVSGMAMLYGGPQMGFSAPEVVHEVALSTDEGLHVSGMAFAGMPFVLIGRNAKLAWTSTTAVGDNVDTYIENLCDAGHGAGSGTRFHDSCTPLARRTETIAVRHGNDVVLQVERSPHGPVVSKTGDHALAQKRVHWLRECRAIEAFWRFNTAATLHEFAAAIPDVVTAHNFLYADNAGNIAYWQAGEVPVRSPHHDFRLPLPGDGSAEWTGKLLPVLSSINPAQGYLANWNNKPSVDFNNADNHFFGAQGRLSVIDERLRQDTLSWDDMADIPRDIARVGPWGRVGLALQPFLLDTFANHPSDDAAVKQALSLVQQWSGNEFDDPIQSITLNPAAVLMAAWQKALLERIFGPTLHADAANVDVNVLLRVLRAGLSPGIGMPVRYPYVVAHELPKILANTFVDTVQALSAQHGTDMAAWRVARPQTQFTHPLVGVVAHLPASYRATYAQRVELGPKGRAESIFTLGQSGFIAAHGAGGFTLDAHYLDLLALYKNFEYKPMPLH